MNSIGGLSNKGFSEMVQWFDTRRLSSGLLFGGLSKCVKINVLKTGPDRQVRPVEPSTGQKTGPIQSKNRFCIEPALNRPNRRSDR